MKKVLLGLIAAVFVLAATYSFDVLEAAEHPGIDDDEIRIAQWGPQTGPAAPWGAVARGSDLLFKLVNEDGGIHGRKIKYFIRDDQYNPSIAKSAVKELVSKYGIFAFTGGVSVSSGMAVMDYLKKNDIIWVGPGSASNIYVFPKRDLIFAVYPLFQDEASILTQFVVEKRGAKKVALLYQSDYGKYALAGCEKRLASFGMKLVEKITVEPTEKDLASQVLKLKNSGADHVIMFVGPTQAVITLKTAAKIGFKPQWVAFDALSDFPLMNQISGGLFNGVIGATFGFPPNSDNPKMAYYREQAKRLAPKERWGLFYYAGIIFAEPLVEGLKRAGRDLSTATLVEAMESMKDFRGIGPTVSFSKTVHQGTDSIRIIQCMPDGTAKVLQEEVSNNLATWKK